MLWVLLMLLVVLLRVPISVPLLFLRYLREVVRSRLQP